MKWILSLFILRRCLEDFRHSLLVMLHWAAGLAHDCVWVEVHTLFSLRTVQMCLFTGHYISRHAAWAQARYSIYISWSFIHSKGATKTPVWERVSKAFESTQGNIERTELSQSLKLGLNVACWEWHAVKKNWKKEAMTNRERAGSGLIPRSIHIFLLTRLPLLVNVLECNMLSLDPVCVDVSSMERFMCADVA